MILFDATALVSLLMDEPAAEDVGRLLESGDAAMPAPNLAEAIDVLVRVYGHDLNDIENAIVPLLATTLPVVALDEAAARRGALLRIDHYHRRESPLSLGDCLLIGTALVLQAVVATSDAAVVRAARAEGLDVVPLRNSGGKRP